MKIIRIKTKIIILQILIGLWTFVTADKSKADDTPSEKPTMKCYPLSDVVSQLDKMRVEIEINNPTAELFIKHMQGADFKDINSKWQNWQMQWEQEVNLAQNDQAHLLLREESFGGLVLNTKNHRVYKLNKDGYEAMKRIKTGYDPKVVIKDQKTRDAFMKLLVEEGIYNPPKSKS